MDLGKVLSNTSGDYYRAAARSVSKAKTNRLLRNILTRKLKIDQAKLDAAITRFINSPSANKNYNMDSRDKDGWEIYHSMADKFSINRNALRLLGNM